MSRTVRPDLLPLARSLRRGDKCPQCGAVVNNVTDVRACWAQGHYDIVTADPMTTIEFTRALAAALGDLHRAQQITRGIAQKAAELAQAALDAQAVAAAQLQTLNDEFGKMITAVRAEPKPPLGL